MAPDIISIKGAGGVGLAAERYGSRDGMPVCLLHGGGQTRWSWGATARTLADRGYCAYAFDLRGHGQSEWSPDGSYALGDFADDARAIVNEMSSPPIIVGASLGGMAALLACGEGPSVKCLALVLVDIAPRLDRSGTERIGDFMRDTLGGFDTLDDAVQAVSGYAGTRDRPPRPEGLLKNLRQDVDGKYRWHWDPLFVTAADGAGWDEQVLEKRLMDAARRVEIPVLIVRGSESDVVSREAMEHLRGALPHVQQVEIVGARHMIAGDDNASFNEAILPFITACTADRGGH